MRPYSQENIIEITDEIMPIVEVNEFIHISDGYRYNLKGRFCS